MIFFFFIFSGFLIMLGENNSIVKRFWGQSHSSGWICQVDLGKSLQLLGFIQSKLGMLTLSGTPTPGEFGISSVFQDHLWCWLG